MMVVMVMGSLLLVCHPPVYSHKLRSPVFSSCCILRRIDTHRIRNLKEKSQPQVDGVGGLPQSVFSGSLEKMPPHLHKDLTFYNGTFLVLLCF